MRLGRTTAIHFSSQVVVTVVGFAATFAIVILLGASGLGRYAVATGLGYFWLIIPAEAVTSAMTKRMSEGEHPGAYLSAGFLVNGALAVGLAALVFGTGEAFRALLAPTNEFVRVISTFNAEIALLLVGSVGFKSVLASLQGEKKVAEKGLLKAAELVVRTTLQVGLVLEGFGVSGLLVGQAASLSVVGAGGMVALSAVRPARPGRTHLRRMAAFAKYSWLGSLKSRTFGWMDTLVLSFFVSSSLIGIYEAAWGIASMLGMVNSSIRNTLFPEFSELSEREEFDRIRHYLDEGLVFSGVFVIPGLFGAAVIGGRVLQFYRQSFDQGATILLLLVFAYVLEVYGSQFVSAINAVDRPDVAFRANRLFVVTNVSLNVVLVWQFGWHGAAAATVLAVGAWAAYAYRSADREIGRLRVPVGEIAREVAASVVMAGVVVVAAPYPPAGRLGTLLLVGLGAGVYLAALLVVSERIRRKSRSLLSAFVDPLAT
jgi:O-antigen/teichoic acid export membrane protein